MTRKWLLEQVAECAGHMATAAQEGRPIAADGWRRRIVSLRRHLLDLEIREAQRRPAEEDLCPVCGAPPSGPGGCIECRLAGRPAKPYPAHWVTAPGVLTWDRADYREREDGTVYYEGAQPEPRPVDWRALIRELRDRAVRL